MGVERPITPLEALPSNCRLRYLLYCLQRDAGPMALADIADQVTIWETGNHGEQRPKIRLRIYNSLYHEQLPVLRDANIVEYDQETDQVEFSPAGADLVPEIRQSFQTELVDLLEAERDAFTDRPDR